MPLNCVRRVNFRDTLIGATTAPIGLTLGVHLVSLVGKHMGMRKVVSRGRAIYFSILLAFLVLPSSSLVIFRAFDCLPIGKSLYLSSDTGINCKSQAYQSGIRLFAIIMLFIYPLGIPLWFFTCIYRHRDAIMKLSGVDRGSLPKKLRKYRFLFQDFASDPISM